MVRVSAIRDLFLPSGVLSRDSKHRNMPSLPKTLTPHRSDRVGAKPLVQPYAFPHTIDHQGLQLARSPHQSSGLTLAESSQANYAPAPERAKLEELWPAEIRMSAGGLPVNWDGTPGRLSVGLTAAQRPSIHAMP